MNIPHLSSYAVQKFRKKMYAYYRKHRRSFPWRDDASDAYCVFISEVMLQQTQTNRSIEKYNEFITAFPNFPTLAQTTEKDVLHIWKGLGYNRRALYLLKSARIVVEKYQGTLPHTFDDLVSLPGIGTATAHSIQAFGFNIPTLFIETNIRSVFIHEFFPDKKNVHDNEIMPLVKQTLDTTHARNWYSALMDYGAMLKKNIANPSQKSIHYKKQEPFHNSDRQIRGMIVRLVLQKPQQKSTLHRSLSIEKKRCMYIAEKMKKEGILRETRGTYHI